MAETDDFRAKRLKQIREHGPFFGQRTLLASTPDRNRRFICDWRNLDRDYVEVWNQDMNPWTAEDDRKFDARLAELNAPFLWQPIETAPKDGTDIKLKIGNGEYIGAWKSNAWCRLWDRRRQHGIGGYIAFNAEHQPTHWSRLGGEPT